MKDEPTPLYIQDVIELLTNIKLKHGNLPVYLVSDEDQLVQGDDDGIQYKKSVWKLPERVEII